MPIKDIDSIKCVFRRSRFVIAEMKCAVENFGKEGQKNACPFRTGDRRQLC